MRSIQTPAGRHRVVLKRRPQIGATVVAVGSLRPVVFRPPQLEPPVHIRQAPRIEVEDKNIWHEVENTPHGRPPSTTVLELHKLAPATRKRLVAVITRNVQTDFYRRVEAHSSEPPEVGVRCSRAGRRATRIWKKQCRFDVHTGMADLEKGSPVAIYAVLRFPHQQTLEFCRRRRGSRDHHVVRAQISIEEKVPRRVMMSGVGRVAGRDSADWSEGRGEAMLCVGCREEHDLVSLAPLDRRCARPELPPLHIHVHFVRVRLFCSCGG